MRSLFDMTNTPIPPPPNIQVMAAGGGLAGAAGPSSPSPWVTVSAAGQQTTSQYHVPIYTFGDENVPFPIYATEGSACFDLCFQINRETFPDLALAAIHGYDATNKKIERPYNPLDNSVRIRPGDRLLFPTSMIFDLPYGSSMRVHPRSGISLKQGLSLINCEGVVDCDYVEEAFIPIVNHSNVSVSVELGSRLAQAEIVLISGIRLNRKNTLFNRVNAPPVRTTRAGGFGSTGV